MGSKFKQIYLQMIILVIFVTSLTGCSVRVGYRGHSSTKKMTASFAMLTDTKTKYITLEAGDTLISYEFSWRERQGS